MLLKRIYDKPEGWERQVNTRALGGVALIDPKKPEGACLNPPPLSHIEVKHTGTTPEQNFSDRLVYTGIREGWITLSKGKLIVHGQPEDLRYTVKRGPGHYCCHCGAALEDAARFVAKDVTAGMQHVADAHPDKESPDPGNPAGYCRVLAFECVLDSEQHTKYNHAQYIAKRNATGKVKSHVRSARKES